MFLAPVNNPKPAAKRKWIGLCDYSNKEQILTTAKIWLICNVYCHDLGVML